jgi:DNA-binding MarR family transcriptional regulator
VRQLQNAGLIRRLQCEEDRRGWTVRLTSAGEDTLRAAAERHARSVRTYLLEVLSDREREQLRRISRKVLAAIEASAVAEGPVAAG